jgi:hypothetical protein
MFNVYLTNKIAGLLLIPIVIGLAYFPYGKSILVNLGIVLITFMYLFRVKRGIQIGISKAKLSYFYLFIYLCTLEILPLAVLVRVFIDNG